MINPSQYNQHKGETRTQLFELYVEGEIGKNRTDIGRLDIALTALNAKLSQMEQGYGEQLKYMDDRIKALEKAEEGRKRLIENPPIHALSPKDEKAFFPKTATYTANPEVKIPIKRKGFFSRRDN